MPSRRIVIAAAAVLGLAVTSGTFLVARSTDEAELSAAVEPLAEVAEAPILSGPAEGWSIGRASFAQRGGQPIELRSGGLPVDVSAVTWHSPSGSVVKEGEHLLSVAGRPVVYLRGDVVSYRDLYLGDRGDDVTALAAALRRLGFDVDPAVVNGATLAAFAELRRRAGGSGELDADELRPLQDARREADRALDDARAEASGAQVELSDSERGEVVRQAFSSVEDAAVQLGRARADAAASPEAPQGTRAVEDAQRAYDRAVDAYRRADASAELQRQVTDDARRRGVQRAEAEVTRLNEEQLRVALSIRAADVVYGTSEAVTLDTGDAGAGGPGTLSLRDARPSLRGVLNDGLGPPPPDAVVEVISKGRTLPGRVVADDPMAARPAVARTATAAPSTSAPTLDAPTGPSAADSGRTGSEQPESFAIALDDPSDLDPAQEGLTVRVRRSVGDGASWSVPAAAIRTDAEATSFVDVRVRGRSEPHQVAVLGSISGRVAISPLEGIPRADATVELHRTAGP